MIKKKQQKRTKHRLTFIIIKTEQEKGQKKKPYIDNVYKGIDNHIHLIKYTLNI